MKTTTNNTATENELTLADVASYLNDSDNYRLSASERRFQARQRAMLDRNHANNPDPFAVFGI
jgi:hypothetical protein